MTIYLSDSRLSNSSQQLTTLRFSPATLPPPQGGVSPGAHSDATRKSFPPTVTRAPTSRNTTVSMLGTPTPNRGTRCGSKKTVHITIGRGVPWTTPTESLCKRSGDASAVGPDAKRQRHPTERLAYLASTLRDSALSDEDAYSKDTLLLYALSIINGDGLALPAANFPSGTVEELPEPQMHDDVMAVSDANPFMQAEAKR